MHHLQNLQVKRDFHFFTSQKYQKYVGTEVMSCARMHAKCIATISILTTPTYKEPLLGGWSYLHNWSYSYLFWYWRFYFPKSFFKVFMGNPDFSWKNKKCKTLLDKTTGKWQSNAALKYMQKSLMKPSSTPCTNQLHEI